MILLLCLALLLFAKNAKRAELTAGVKSDYRLSVGCTSLNLELGGPLSFSGVALAGPGRARARPITHKYIIIIYLYTGLLVQL